MTCPVCKEPVEPWQRYYLNGKVKEHEQCHENRIRRESREMSEKSGVVKMEYKSKGK